MFYELRLFYILQNGMLNFRELKTLRRKFKKFKYKKCFMFVCDKNNDSVISSEEFSTCFNTGKI